MNALTAFFHATLLQSGWAERVGWTLLHSVWQIALVAALCALVSALLRNRSAVARYTCGCVALLAMVALPMGTYLLLPDDVAAQTTGRPRVAKSAVALALIGGGEDAPFPHPAASPGPIGVATVSVPVAAGTPDSLAAASWSGLRPWMPWATAAWLAGVMLLSLRPICGWLHVRQLQRHGLSPLSNSLRQAAGRLACRLGVKQTVQFVQSTFVEVPTVVGYLRPIVLLPASAITGLSVVEIELILAHELAHVRRHDYLVNLGQTVIESLLFFHPGMWWVSSQVRQERENCCDDIAVALNGDRAEYVRALTRLEQQRLAAPVAVLAATGGSLLDRVRRLLGKPAAEFGYRSTTAWLTGLMTIGFVSLALAIGNTSQGDFEAPTEAAVKAVTETQPPSGESETAKPADATKPESNREAMLAYARALAAGDFDTLKQTWEFEDDFERQFAGKLAEMFARTRNMTVDLVSMERLTDRTLFACFLLQNGPDRFGRGPVPLPLTFHRKEGRWRCPPPGDLRTLVNVRGMGVERLGRRAITQQMIAVRFGSGDWTARMEMQRAVAKARADAFARLAGPPYNLSQFEAVARQMTDQVEEQEGSLSAIQSWQDVWRLALEKYGKDALPRPDDFTLSFYLEAKKDDPNARKLPFADPHGSFLVEPFPCLTEGAVLQAQVSMDPNRHVPGIDVKLTQAGTKIFAQLTRDSVGKRLAIAIDGKVVSAPTLRAPILEGNAQIDGNFTRQEAEAIVEQLNSYRKKAQEFLEALGKDVRGVKKPKSAPKKAVQLTRPTDIQARERFLAIDRFEAWLEKQPTSNAAQVTPWGKPVNGVQARLAGAERVLGRSDWPHPVLRLHYDAKNEGRYTLHLPENGRCHQVEVDGQWYQWVDPRRARKHGQPSGENQRCSAGARWRSGAAGDSGSL